MANTCFSSQVYEILDNAIDEVQGGHARVIQVGEMSKVAEGQRLPHFYLIEPYQILLRNMPYFSGLSLGIG